MVKNVVATKDMTQGKRKNEFREAMHQVRPSLASHLHVLLTQGLTCNVNGTLVQLHCRHRSALT
jgi:hypothetical protein